MRFVRSIRRCWLVLTVAVAAMLTGVSQGLLANCGPFTDVAADQFCPFVLEVFYIGITTGTTPTTYDPASNVTRLQMAAFLSRAVDGVLKRGSRRAALRQAWTPQNAGILGLTTLGTNPRAVESDGADLWIANKTDNSISRVRGSDAKLLETWTGATSGFGVIVAMGRVFVTGETSPGRLYMIDPSQPAGAVTTVASNLGNSALGIAFDGSRFWTGNYFSSVSIVTPGATIPWTVTTVSTGFGSLGGALYDGSNVWVTDNGAGKLFKLDGTGAILQTVTVGVIPEYPVSDGANIWVPNYLSNSISVVRASSGAVLATLTGNGLIGPLFAAFDGQRVLVTNFIGGANSVSLWRADDFTTLGSFATGPGTTPFGAASDGVNFWITLYDSGKLARF